MLDFRCYAVSLLNKQLDKIILPIETNDLPYQTPNEMMNDYYFRPFTIPVGIYLFKVNNRNTKTRYDVCSKLTIKTLERRHSVSIVNFEQVNADWDRL